MRVALRRPPRPPRSTRRARLGRTDSPGRRRAGTGGPPPRRSWEGRPRPHSWNRPRLNCPGASPCWAAVIYSPAASRSLWRRPALPNSYRVPTAFVASRAAARRRPIQRQRPRVRLRRLQHAAHLEPEPGVLRVGGQRRRTGRISHARVDRRDAGHVRGTAPVVGLPAARSQARVNPSSAPAARGDERETRDKSQAKASHGRPQSSRTSLAGFYHSAAQLRDPARECSSQESASCEKDRRRPILRAELAGSRNAAWEEDHVDALLSRWERLCAEAPVWRFLDIALRGVGQVMFQDNPLSGDLSRRHRVGRDLAGGRAAVSRASSASSSRR